MSCICPFASAFNCEAHCLTKPLKIFVLAMVQVYVAVEGVEKNVGLDPSDPLVQLAVALGGSATVG
jgi:hypothetical protein